MALYFDLGVALADLQTGALTRQWGQWITDLFGRVDTINGVVNTLPGVNKKTLAQLNALGLGAADAGYLAWVTDYAHQVYWDGAAWQWLDGDRPARFADYAVDPGVGWALCDGAATTYLAGIGTATLVATAFTTPNLSATAAYRKSAAAYTGTLNAASGTTGTGSTGTGSTGTGTTGAGSAHSHTNNFSAPVIAGGVGAALSGAGGSLLASIVGTTDAESAHTHSVPSLSVPSLSVPALAVGSIDMPNLGTLPYVRR